MDQKMFNNPASKRLASQNNWLRDRIPGRLIFKALTKQSNIVSNELNVGQTVGSFGYHVGRSNKLRMEILII